MLLSTFASASWARTTTEQYGQDGQPFLTVPHVQALVRLAPLPRASIFEAGKCSVKQHLTESSEMHFSSRVRQHNSTSRSKKAAAKVHAWIPAASSSGLRLVGCFFVTDKSEFKISCRISPAFPAGPKLRWTARAASAIACCSMEEEGGGGGASKPRRSCSILASTRNNLVDLYPATQRTAAPNVTMEGVSGNGCRLAASHISTKKRLLPSLLSLERGVYMSALRLAKAVSTWPGSAASLIAMSREPVRGSWTTGGASHHSLLGKACKQTAPRPTVQWRDTQAVSVLRLLQVTTSLRPESPAPSADECCEAFALF